MKKYPIFTTKLTDAQQLAIWKVISLNNPKTENLNGAPPQSAMVVCLGNSTNVLVYTKTLERLVSCNKYTTFPTTFPYISLSAERGTNSQPSGVLLQ